MDTATRSQPRSVEFPAADGYPLRGTYWPGPETPVAALLINAATGVAARYYSRFGDAMAERGFRVLAYDYRGIGESRPAQLRGFRATKLDWGALDCEGALRLLHMRADGLPLYAACHSIGGFALGLAESATQVERALFVGCQYAYWRDYARHVRLPYLLRWHAFMPAVAGVLGYFPGKRLGWLEDLPQGVAFEWAFRFDPRFHRFYRHLPHASRDVDGHALERRMAAFRGKILSIADVHDEYATPAACRRLLDHFPQAERRFVQLDLEREGLPTMGHFGFFHARYRDSLWERAAEWLEAGRDPWPAR
jgi:predicted alpha/beta hydrolase